MDAQINSYAREQDQIRRNITGNPGGNSDPEGACTVAAGSNDGNGTITFTDSSGRRTTYALGVPEG